LGVCAAGAQLAVETFPRRRTGVGAEALPINGHAQSEHFDEPILERGWQPAAFPHREHAVALAAAAAFTSAISQFVARTMLAVRTTFHSQTSVNLVRFG